MSIGTIRYKVKDSCKAIFQPAQEPLAGKYGDLVRFTADTMILKIDDWGEVEFANNEIEEVS